MAPFRTNDLWSAYISYEFIFESLTGLYLPIPEKKLSYLEQTISDSD